MKNIRKKVLLFILLIAFLCASGFYYMDRLNISDGGKEAEAAGKTGSGGNIDTAAGIIGGADGPTSILVSDSGASSAAGSEWVLYIPEKDETVYVNLNNDGSVSKINVVNHIKVEKAGTYVDYGNYSTVVNLTGEAEPVISGDELSWDIRDISDDLYYQGELPVGELPWNFTIEYQLDGRTVNASELAGASGELTLTIDAKENKLAQEYFRKNYMLQITVPVNMSNTTLISAPGAVEMVTGHTDTLAYTALPQASGHYVIKARVKDFAADGIDIAMMKTDMTSYIDADEMTQGFETMSGGMTQLTDGTLALKEGISQLSGGITTIAQGAGDLSEGTGKLSTGMEQFDRGMDDFADGLDTLATGSAGMKKGLNGLSDNGKKLLTGYQGVEDGLSSILEYKDQITTMTDEMLKSTDLQTVMLAQAIRGQLDGLTKLQSGLDELNANLDQYLKGVNKTAMGYATLDSGIQALPDGFDKLSGGFSDIKAGNETVYSGISDMSKGLSDMDTSASRIPDQIQKLADGQKSMKEGVDEAITQIKALTGTSGDQASSQPVSFAAPGKITPKSVQFVLRTPSIEKSAVQEDTTDKGEEKDSFWDRLMKLF